MFKNLGLKDFFQLLVLIIVAIVIVIVYSDNQIRNKLWQKTYPIRAELSSRTLSCSKGAPSWLAEVIRFRTKYLNAPSNQIAYLDADGRLHHCESGYMGSIPIKADKVTTDTRFRYASVTKLWTSDVIFDLINEGVLDLDTPLVSLLAEIDNPIDRRINDITIGQLLLHRGGFNRYSVFGNDMFGIGKEICPNHIKRMNEIKLSFNPDERMSYSNLGYCLLGEVISRHYDKPYAEVIRDKYQLDDTTIKFVGNNAMPDEVFYHYVSDKLTGVDIYNGFNFSELASVAGLSGNAVDLAKQVSKMQNKPAMNILSMNDSLSCDLTVLRDCYGYAMFPYQQSAKEPVVFFRDGGLIALSSLVATDEAGRVVVLLSNGTPTNGDVDNDKIKKIIYQAMAIEK